MSFKINKEILVNTIQKKLFDTNKEFFNYLDVDDYSPFLEPLLFSWFKQNEAKNITLEQILFGYMCTNDLNLDFQVFSDETGIIYLPNYGYLHSKARGKTLNLTYAKGIVSLMFKNMTVPYFFEPIKKLVGELVLLQYNNDLIKNYIEISPYELYLPDHPLHHLYSENYRYSIDQVILAEINTSRTHYLHYEEIKKALKLIEKYDINLFSELISSNRFIFPFENKLVRSFTNPASLGGIYLSTTPSDGLIFYIEEIIHQGSHNFLDVFMLNREEYFQVDSEKMMGDFSGSLTDHRTLFDAFHGLYTVSKRVSFFEKILNHTELFSEQEFYEYQARFFDLKKRLKTGIESIDHKNVFTAKGLDLYNKLMNICITSLNKFKEYYPNIALDMSNQPVNFSYFHFVNSNPTT